MKLVFGIIKDRLQKHINGLRILNSRQFGFRSLRGTPHAGLAATAAFEDALRRQMEIHAVFLDIKKAYDSVCRILGKDVAMRRLGLPEEVIELFSEIDRGNRNRVRTAGNWVQTDDDWDNPDAYTFTAESGFTQGATESPFLWVMFYDMVLAALQELGVGNSVRLGTHGFNSIDAGLIALADDTTILERTRADMQRSLGSLSRVLRLAHLQVAPEKSIHTALQWTVVNGTPKFWLQEELVAKARSSE